MKFGAGFEPRFDFERTRFRLGRPFSLTDKFGVSDAIFHFSFVASRRLATFGFSFARRFDANGRDGARARSPRMAQRRRSPDQDLDE